MDNNFIDISDLWFNGNDTKLTYVDLFCGAGGVSKGFELAGFEGIAAIDFFKEAVETHRKNIKCDVIFGDITDENVKSELYDTVERNLNGRELDVLHASPPCQGFSMAGRRMIDDPRNVLYKEAVEIINHLKPRWITMENVPGLMSMKGGEVVKQIKEDLSNIGYKVETMVLNAADYYTPQIRKRWILIGTRENKEIKFPQPLLDSDHYLTVKDAIEDLIGCEEKKSWNHIFTRHSPEMAKRLEELEEGKPLNPKYQASWKKSPWDKPSCTVMENHGGVNVHPRVPRVITPREMARLQSFPDDFIFCGGKGKQQVQIGNAVPCNLAKAIALAVVKNNESNTIM